MVATNSQLAIVSFRRLSRSRLIARNRMETPHTTSIHGAENPENGPIRRKLTAAPGALRTFAFAPFSVLRFLTFRSEIAILR